MPVRFAREADSDALLAIYAQYIDTTITFEYDLPTEREFAGRIREISAEYPYLVYEDGGQIAGYAYAHRHRARAAYQWNAELSIYLDRAYTARGIGRRLYAMLIELLRMQGLKTVYGIMTVPNAGSEALHLGLGFARLATFHNTGYKNGTWRDTVWFEKQIGPFEPAPRPIIPIGQLPREDVEAVLTPSKDCVF